MWLERAPTKGATLPGGNFENYWFRPKKYKGKKNFSASPLFWVFCSDRIGWLSSESGNKSWIYLHMIKSALRKLNMKSSKGWLWSWQDNSIYFFASESKLLIRFSKSGHIKTRFMIVMHFFLQQHKLSGMLIFTVIDNFTFFSKKLVRFALCYCSIFLMTSCELSWKYLS